VRVAGERSRRVGLQMEAHAEKVWKIVGYDGTKKFFERVLPLGSLSEGEMTSLLQRLAAQHLTSDEIVNASLRRNAKSYAPLLEPQQEARPPPSRFSITVGLSPNYVASVWTADEFGETSS
jgi:hypothetical protein